ncbi:MAG: hypothetical protein ABEH88_09470 [Halobacteriales archaeon]
MTRVAAQEGFEAFISEAIEITYREFNVITALQGVHTPGSGTVDRLLKQSDTLDRRVVRPELRAFRADVMEQFNVLLEYVTSHAGIEAYREELLATDRYAQSLRDSLSPERRKRLQDRLVARQKRLGDAIEPIVTSPHDEYWSALVEEYDRNAALALIEENFEFTSLLREERNAFAMEVRIDPADVLSGVGSLLGSAIPAFTVEYTDEAVRAMRTAERRVIAETRAEVESRFVEYGAGG